MTRPGMISEPIDKLEAALADEHNGFTRGDREFAGSLVHTFRRYGKLSPKQEPWVEKLLERAEHSSTTGTMAPKPAKHVTQSIGSVASLMKIFDNVRAAHIQHPKIRILVDGKKIQLTWSHKFDSISIVAERGPGDVKDWIGALDRNGTLTLSTKYPAPKGLTEELIRLATDPSKGGGAMGKRMRSCCFCGSPLTSRDSLWYGYGPICAEKWGLEWGEVKARANEFIATDASIPESFMP